MNLHLRRPAIRAFLIADVMMALALLGVIAAIVIVSSSRTDRAADRLSNARHAGRIAEELLIDLEAGLPLPSADAQTQIRIESSDGGAQVPGKRWVQVVVTYQGESRLLVGLVPEATAVQPAGGAR
jgi:type II secretory pathway pseudopilin PulG